MGALAALLDDNLEAYYAARSRVVVRPRRRLGSLGSSYFSASVAARGWPSQYDDLITQAASDAGVDPLLIRAIISAESEWNPTVCSNRPTPPGSCGLMQLNVAAHGITMAQATDPGFNIPFGARLIADQIRRRSTVQLALAAYNAGTGRSEADLTDRINRNVNGVGTYVQTVLDYLTWYQTQQAGTALEPPPDPAAEGSTDTASSDGSGDVVSTTLAAMDPWMWYALGGAVALGVVLVIVSR
jgi:soluble lytic murein transglycosylase-like protein